MSNSANLRKLAQVISDSAEVIERLGASLLTVARQAGENKRRVAKNKKDILLAFNEIEGLKSLIKKNAENKQD